MSPSNKVIDSSTFGNFSQNGTVEFTNSELSLSFEELYTASPDNQEQEEEIEKNIVYFCKILAGATADNKSLNSLISSIQQYLKLFHLKKRDFLSLQRRMEVMRKNSMNLASQELKEISESYEVRLLEERQTYQKVLFEVEEKIERYQKLVKDKETTYELEIADIQKHYEQQKERQMQYITERCRSIRNSLSRLLVQPEELPSLVAGIENFLLEFPGFVALQQKNQWNNTTKILDDEKFILQAQLRETTAKNAELIRQLESVEEKFKQTERSMGKAKVLVEMLNHERDTTWVPLEAKQVQLVNEIRLLKQSLSASETSLERANQEQKSLEEELLEKEKALAVLRGELECLQTTLARRETEWRTATEKVEQLERLTGQQQQKVAQLEKELARNAHVNKKMREQKAMLEASVLETNRRAEELYRNLEAAQETLSSKEGQLQEEVHLRLQLQKIKGELKAQHERSVAEADNFRALIGYFAPQILDNSCTEYTLQQVLHVSVDLKNSLNKKTAQQKSAIKYLNNYAFEFLHGLEVQQTLQKTIEEKVQKIAGIEKLVAEQFDKILEERKGTAVELDFIREENKKLMQVNQHFINLTKKLEHEKAALESQMIANMTDITRQNEKLTTFAVTSKNTRDAEVQQLQSEREFLAREVLSLKKQLNEEREKNTAIQTEIEVANSAVLRLSQPSRTPAVGPCDSCGAFTRQIEDLNHQNSVLRVDCDDLKARYEHVISAYECVKDENETLYAEQRDLLDKYHRLSEDLRELLHYHHKQRETHNFAFQTLKNKYESLDPDDYELQKVRVRELTSELDTVLLSRKEALDKYNSCQSELQKAIQRIDELQAVIRQYHQIDSLLDSSDLNSTEIYLNKLIDLDQSEQLSLSRDDARMSAVTNIIEELKDARPMREAVALLWTLYKSSDSVLPDSLDSTAFPEGKINKSSVLQEASNEENEHKKEMNQLQATIAYIKNVMLEEQEGANKTIVDLKSHILKLEEEVAKTQELLLEKMKSTDELTKQNNSQTMPKVEYDNLLRDLERCKKEFSNLKEEEAIYKEEAAEWHDERKLLLLKLEEYSTKEETFKEEIKRLVNNSNKGEELLLEKLRTQKDEYEKIVEGLKRESEVLNEEYKRLSTEYEFLKCQLIESKRDTLETKEKLAQIEMLEARLRHEFEELRKENSDLHWNNTCLNEKLASLERDKNLLEQDVIDIPLYKEHLEKQQKQLNLVLEEKEVLSRELNEHKKELSRIKKETEEIIEQMEVANTQQITTFVQKTQEYIALLSRYEEKAKRDHVSIAALKHNQEALLGALDYATKQKLGFLETTKQFTKGSKISFKAVALAVVFAVKLEKTSKILRESSAKTKEPLYYLSYVHPLTESTKHINSCPSRETNQLKKMLEKTSGFPEARRPAKVSKLRQKIVELMK